MFVFLWEEQRLTSQGYQSSHVLSLGKKNQRITTRSSEEAAKELLDLCQKNGGSFEELKSLRRLRKAKDCEGMPNPNPSTQDGRVRCKH